MIDIHSHLLFSVDDGCDDITTSIKLIKEAKDKGVTDVIITPHRNVVYKTTANELKEKFSTSFRNAFEKCQTRIKIRDIRKRLHNSNIDPLVQLQENMETITKENKLQIGKTGNSSTGEISDIHKQTAKTQIECAKQAIIQRRLSQEKS